MSHSWREYNTTNDYTRTRRRRKNVLECKQKIDIELYKTNANLKFKEKKENFQKEIERKEKEMIENIKNNQEKLKKKIPEEIEKYKVKLENDYKRFKKNKENEINLNIFNIFWYTVSRKFSVDGYHVKVLCNCFTYYKDLLIERIFVKNDEKINFIILHFYPRSSSSKITFCIDSIDDKYHCQKDRLSIVHIANSVIEKNSTVQKEFQEYSNNSKSLLDINLQPSDIHNYLQRVKEDNKDLFPKLFRYLEGITNIDNLILSNINIQPINNGSSDLVIDVFDKFLCEEVCRLNHLCDKNDFNFIDSTFNMLNGYVTPSVKRLSFLEQKKMVIIGGMVSRFIRKSSYTAHFNFLKVNGIKIPILISDDDIKIILAYKNVYVGYSVVCFNHIFGSTKNSLKLSNKNWNEKTLFEFNFLREKCKSVIKGRDLLELEKYFQELIVFVDKVKDTYLTKIYGKMNYIKKQLILNNVLNIEEVYYSNISEGANHKIKKEQGICKQKSYLENIKYFIDIFKYYRLQILQLRLGINSIWRINKEFQKKVLYKDYKNKLSQYRKYFNDKEKLLNFQIQWSKGKDSEIDYIENVIYPMINSNKYSQLSVNAFEYYPLDIIDYNLCEKSLYLLNNEMFICVGDVYKFPKPRGGFSQLCKYLVICQDCEVFDIEGVCEHLVTIAEIRG